MTVDSVFKIGLIGGTGFEDPDVLKMIEEYPMENTPFGTPSDSLIEGFVQGIPCVLLSRHGRQHHISPTEINYRANIWALKKAGASMIISVSACGSLRQEIAPGHFVVLDSFIDRTTKREQSFYDGKPGHPEGICHMPMHPTFNEKLRQLMISTLSNLGLNHHAKGTLICVEGPRFSSRAESELFQKWGADIVGMTLCPEVVLAKELGIPYVTLAAVTDYDCWKDCSEGVNIGLVKEMMEMNAKNLRTILVEVMKAVGERREEFLEETAKAKELATNSVMDGGRTLDFEHLS